VSEAGGTAKRHAALKLVDRHRDRRKRNRIILGADKAYDMTAFVQELRKQKVTAHIAIDGHMRKTGKPRRTAIDKRTLRHAGCVISRHGRKRIEDVLGWSKSSAGFAKAKLRGRVRVNKLHHGGGGLRSHLPAKSMQWASAAGPRKHLEQKLRLKSFRVRTGSGRCIL
jgi:hypothetical protein